jgi:hypothetical protein
MYTGWALGVLNAGLIFKNKDISSGQKWAEQSSNAFGTFVPYP